MYPCAVASVTGLRMAGKAPSKRASEDASVLVAFQDHAKHAGNGWVVDDHSTKPSAAAHSFYMLVCIIAAVGALGIGTNTVPMRPSSATIWGPSGECQGSGPS